MTDHSLTWEQVHAWRLAQHSLLTRAVPEQLLAVVSRIGGVHAQLFSAAESSLWARVADLPPGAVTAALWEERTLVKTWAMRGTLHLLPAAELPLYVAARAAQKLRRPPSYYTYHGVAPEEYDAIQAAVPQVLGETPLTREQLAAAVAEHTGLPNLREVLLSGWGALLKPAAFVGALCFGPNQGQNVTFVRPDHWLPAHHPPRPPVMEPHAAWQELARRYLRAYGPATAEDFARWWGTDAAAAKKLFRAMGDELAAVMVEGAPGWVLAADVAPLQAQPAARCVRLLPQFDVYTVGCGRDRPALLPDEHKGRVYRPQGWIAAVVLVDGRMAGVWEQEQARGKVVVKASLFAPLPAGREVELRDEVERLGTWLGVAAELQIEDE